MADTPGFRSRAERARLELEQPPRNAAAAEARAMRRANADPDPRATLQEIAAALGHDQVAVEPTVSGARWFAWCRCGWVSTTRRDAADATGAVVHHVRKAMRAWTNSGLPLAAYGQAPAPDWNEVGRLHRHWAEKRAQDSPEESARLPDSVGRPA